MELLFATAACNARPGAVVWGRSSGMIAYGAASLVVIGDREALHVNACLRGHSPAATVTAISWVDEPIDCGIVDPSHRIVSGANDGHIIVWLVNAETRKYEIVVKLEAHTNAVARIDALVSSEGQIIVASTGLDGYIHIYELCQNEQPGLSAEDTLSQRIHCGNGSHALPMAVALVEFCGYLWLALGSTSAVIRLYMRRLKGGKFVLVATLEGHSDWLNDFSFCVENENTCLLASVAHDRFVRIWEIERSPSGEWQAESGSSRTCGDLLCTSLGYRGQLICDEAQKFMITLGSVVEGHDDWIYSVEWSPVISKGSSKFELLTASVDKTMALWEYSDDEQMWECVMRTGEVGGHTYGCFGAVFSPDALQILGFTYGGALHRWVRNTCTSSVLEYHTDSWKPAPVISGHAAPVSGLTWDASSAYLLTAGKDQTTRLFAQLTGLSRAWHECSRPQIHGHDMSCICALPYHRFVSAAEEKVVRVFEASAPSLRLLQELASVNIDASIDSACDLAAPPELGLSNKAMLVEGSGSISLTSGSSAPPLENYLVQRTLWPEIQKVYGHGYEIFCVCSSHDGKYLASSCSARSAKHAIVRLTETSEWKEVQTLSGHQLTIADMKFSYDDKYLLTVSRDRTFCIFRKTKDESGHYELMQQVQAHGRIIWSCSWMHGEYTFATGSRDKMIKLWTLVDGVWTLESETKLSSPVTSIAFAPYKRPLLAIGMESGLIELHTLDERRKWQVEAKVPESNCHNGIVKQMAWRATPSSLQLATCGYDHTVRIFEYTESIPFSPAL